MGKKTFFALFAVSLAISVFSFLGQAERSIRAQERSEDLRQQGEDLIPFELLEEADLQRAEAILERCTLKRRIRERKTLARREAYDWLLDRLPLTSVFMRELDLCHYKFTVKGEREIHIAYRGRPTGEARLIFREKGLRVYYGRGFIDSPFIPRISGRGLFALRYYEGKDGYLNVDGQYFFRIDSKFLHMVTQAFKGLVGEAIDDKLFAAFDAVSDISERVERDPWVLYELLPGHPEVSRKELQAFKDFFILGIGAKKRAY
jgi:hypothetical protein